MLWLFVKTLTVDDKYSVLNRDNFKQQIHMQLSKKQNSQLIYIRNYGLAKKRLDKYLKSVASQYPSTSYMVKALRHISNHHGGTFIMIVDLQ